MPASRRLRAQIALAIMGASGLPMLLSLAWALVEVAQGAELSKWVAGAPWDINTYYWGVVVMGCAGTLLWLMRYGAPLWLWAGALAWAGSCVAQVWLAIRFSEDWPAAAITVAPAWVGAAVAATAVFSEASEWRAGRLPAQSHPGPACAPWRKATATAMATAALILILPPYTSVRDLREMSKSPYFFLGHSGGDFAIGGSVALALACVWMFRRSPPLFLSRALLVVFGIESLWATIWMLYARLGSFALVNMFFGLDNSDLVPAFTVCAGTMLLVLAAWVRWPSGITSKA